jgi:hypothetical protein
LLLTVRSEIQTLHQPMTAVKQDSMSKTILSRVSKRIQNNAASFGGAVVVAVVDGKHIAYSASASLLISSYLHTLIHRLLHRIYRLSHHCNTDEQ